MARDGRPVEPAVVAAIVAALAAHLGTVPSALAVRSVRPVGREAAAGSPPSAWPAPWALAGRLDLAGARAALLWRRR